MQITSGSSVQQTNNANRNYQHHVHAGDFVFCQQLGFQDIFFHQFGFTSYKIFSWVFHP